VNVPNSLQHYPIVYKHSPKRNAAKTGSPNGSNSDNDKNDGNSSRPSTATDSSHLLSPVFVLRAMGTFTPPPVPAFWVAVEVSPGVAQSGSPYGGAMVTKWFLCLCVSLVLRRHAKEMNECRVTSRTPRASPRWDCASGSLLCNTERFTEWVFDGKFLGETGATLDFKPGQSPRQLATIDQTAANYLWKWHERAAGGVLTVSRLLQAARLFCQGFPCSS
jgi:hypothetical protein